MKRLSIWIVIFAWLSGALGIVGAFTVFIIGARLSEVQSSRNSKQQAVTQAPISSPISIKEKKPAVINNDQKEASEIINIKKEQPKSIEKEPIVEQTKITPPPKIAEKAIKLVKPHIVNAPIPIKIIELPKKSVKEIPNTEPSEIGGTEEKILDQQELSQLLAQIKDTKQAQGIWANCIRVVRSKAGNNKRATSQIEMYLRNHNYSITGKEESTQKNKGVLVIGNNDCIKIVVGEF